MAEHALSSLAAWSRAQEVTRREIVNAIIEKIPGLDIETSVGGYGLAAFRFSRIPLVLVPGGTFRVGLLPGEENDILRRLHRNPNGPGVQDTRAEIERLRANALPVQTISLAPFLCIRRPLFV